MLKKILVLSLSLLTVNYNLHAAESRYPLHEAVKNGDSASVKELLKHCDVNQKDNYGDTPLHWAADNRHHAVAQLLLEAHATVDAKDNYGVTPLHKAAYNGNHAVAQLLLAAHATVDVKDNAGYTPLHYAAREGHHDVAQLLLAAHATIDVKDNDGRTPLHLAAQYGHHDVEYLLTHWSDFKRGLCVLLCKSILASCHPRCGAHSSVAMLSQHSMSMIIGNLPPGQCIYSPEEIQMYVQLWQALQQQNNGKCIVC